MITEQNTKATLLLAPQAMTNSATVTANFDTIDATTLTKGNYATIRIHFASEINTNAVGPTISVLESDDTVATNFGTITADRDTEAFVTAKSVVYCVDLRGRKRYLRLSVSTDTTTNDNVTVAAEGILTRNAQAPASTSDIADAVVIV